MSFRPLFFLALSVLSLVLPARAQRQMEALGRGVVAMRTNSTQVYVGWRLLGDDPSDIGFNLYRSIGGAAATKLNTSAPFTASTNYIDTPGSAALASAISYYVVPVRNGVEQAPSAAYTLAANASGGQQFIRLPLATATPNPASTSLYDVKFCWVGDFDGDGEYDFLLDRVSTAATAERQYLEAYKRDGTFLWRMDMGPNSVNQYAYEPGSSAISVGDTDNVTVYDLDGDGKAEVAVRTANGVTVTNSAGQVVATVAAASDSSQFVSVVNGLTGAELARAALPNPWAQHGTLTSKCAIAYLDGRRPSVLFYGYNRADNNGAFYRVFSTFDYRDGQLSLRWSTPQIFHGSEGHQIRVADVDNDGKDEICDIGHVIDDDGTQLFDIPEISHGDRFHVADINPDRPGLENYIIQQNNPSFLATAYFDAGTGQMLKKWYATDVVDVGRGVALDLNSSSKGYEMASTQPGIFDAKGRQLYANSFFPYEGLWWDGDLLREFIAAADGDGRNPVINKFNESTGGVDRVWSIYSDFGSFINRTAFGGRPAFWGDILGDWREELVFVSSDCTAIRIYTTTNLATNRLYTLMHNPAYRTQATTKGYVQNSNVDYYLGVGMTVPPPPPMVPARLAWAGGPGASTWDAGSTAAWKNTATSVASAFSAGDSVRFDLAGGNASPIALSGALQPGDVTVYSPIDYTFDGAAGSLDGPMKLVKAGKGSLRITGSHAFTGATTVWDGALRVDGALTGSALTVWGGTWGGVLAKGLSGGRLAGTGTVSQPVSLQYRGAITPGAGMGSAGTLALGGGLSAVDGSTLAFDLSTDPSGLTLANDRLAITGNLSLSGTVSILINPLSGQLAPGAYTLATYTGALTGSTSNLSVVIPEGTPYTVSLASGALTLVIPVTRAAAAATWTGSASSAWDLAGSSNWQVSGSPGVFVSGDSVTFDDTGATRPSVSLNVAAPVAGLTFAGSTNYTLSGSGAIAGPGGLAKSGASTVTLNTTNTFTGPVSVTGGVLAVNNLADGGEPSSLGASSADAANFTLNGGTLRLVGAQTNTNRSLTLGSSGGVIDVPVASVTLQISGGISGPGSLAKSGAGAFILAGANTYAGGTVLQAGTLVLASDTANTSGLGSGGITLQGGTLRMYDNTGSSNTSAWPINIPAGASARFEPDGRCVLAGALTGSGTLAFYTTYVRTDITGNWSAFAGTLNVTADSDGGDLRLSNTHGLANAVLNLASASYTYSIVNSSHTFAIGALSGSGPIAGNSNSGRTVTWQIGARNLDTAYSGAISNGAGVSALTKVGTGTLTLSGASTYTGATTVSAGKLRLSGGSLSGSAITVASGAGFGGNGTVTGNVTFNAGSTLLANPASPLAITGNLTLGGAVSVSPVPGATLAAGTYTLYTCTGTLTGTPTFAWSGAGYTATFNTSVAGSVTYTLAVDTSRPAGDVTWTGAASATWDSSALNWNHTSGSTFFKDGDRARLDDSSSVLAIALSGTLSPAAVVVDSTKNYALSGSGFLAGSGTLTKSGSGILTLSTANTFTGGTTLAGGSLALGAGGSLSGSIAVTGNSIFQMAAPGTNFPSNAIALSSGAGLALSSASLSNGYSGSVSGPADSALTLSGPVSFSASGTAQLGGFLGTVTIPSGSQLRFSSTSGPNGNGGASASFVINGTLNTRNAGGAGGVVLGSLSGSGSIQGQTNTTAGSVTFFVGAKGLDTTFSGTIANGANGSALLTKLGSGALVLSGASTYTGATTVSSGALHVTGSLGATTVSVSSGATFGGTGTLAGNLALASGSRLALGFGPSSTKGPTVSGTSTLNGSITVVPALLGGPLAPGTYPLLTYTGTLAGSPAFSWLDTTGSGYTASFDTSTAGLVKITLVAPLTALQSWRVAHFGSGAADGSGSAADEADPDHDGLANLLEYALGTDPTLNAPSPLALSTSSSTLGLTFNRIADPALTYVVQGSTDLATWTDLWTSSGSANLAGPVTVSDTAALSSFARRFLRLRVSH